MMEPPMPRPNPRKPDRYPGGAVLHTFGKPEPGPEMPTMRPACNPLLTSAMPPAHESDEPPDPRHPFVPGAPDPRPTTMPDWIGGPTSGPQGPHNPDWFISTVLLVGIGLLSILFLFGLGFLAGRARGGW